MAGTGRALPGPLVGPMLWLWLTACAPEEEEKTPSSCPTDIGETTLLASGFADGTEGIAFSDGHLLVSFPGGVTEIAADGTVGSSTPLEHALGLAPAEGGVLVADPGEFTMNGSGDDGHLRYVSLSDGEAVDLASGMPNPNFVAFAPWGEVLVSDDTGEVLYAVDTSGGVRPWLEGIPSPNGIAFSEDGTELYVASTFVADPPIWRVSVGSDGTPGTPEKLISLPTGVAPDGLTVDADGQVWVAANLAGELWRIDPSTGDSETMVTGLENPASLAFGAGEGFDPCSLYVTSLYGESVWQVTAGVEGLPLPAAPAP